MRRAVALVSLPEVPSEHRLGSRRHVRRGFVDTDSVRTGSDVHGSLSPVPTSTQPRKRTRHRRGGESRRRRARGSRPDRHDRAPNRRMNILTGAAKPGRTANAGGAMLKLAADRLAIASRRWATPRLSPATVARGRRQPGKKQRSRSMRTCHRCLAARSLPKDAQSDRGRSFGLICRPGGLGRLATGGPLRGSGRASRRCHRASAS
jgi:hypothetical protein